jgi:bifunctional DNA-binding transcriptional regulator/antitoxin component of YhaV-PrlF toxin-antitoxin module
MPKTTVIDKQLMDALASGLPSKSAKMRRLARAGYERADIARYLGVRYQFVYNVLAAPDPDKDGGGASPIAKVVKSSSSMTTHDDRTPEIAAPRWAWVAVEKGGRIDVPASFLEALGLREGDQVQLALEGDTVRVLTRVAALRELRARVRQCLPEGVSLVDELIAERRAEAATDAADG